MSHSLQPLGYRVEGLAGEKHFLLFQNVHNISGALPVFSLVGTGVYFLGVKQWA